MKIVLAIFLAVLLFLLAVPIVGRAATDRFQAFDVWPRVGERHFFSLDSSQTLFRYQYDFQLSNMIVWRPLDLIDASGLRVSSVVNYSIGHFISGAIGITDYWQVGMTLPVFSSVSFADPLIDPSPGASGLFRVGDLRLSSKVRVIDAYRHRFGLAFEPFATIPLGGDDAFVGNSSVTGGFHAIGDVLVSKKVRIALNLGAEFHGERVIINNIDFTHRWLSSLGVSFDAGHNLTLSAEAHVNTTFSDFFSDRDTIPVEFLGAVQWDIKDTGFRVGAGGGTCAVCGAGGAKARGFLNLSYRRMSDSYRLKEKQELDMMYVTLGLGVRDSEKLAYEIYNLAEKCPLDRSRFVTDRDDPKCMEVYELRDLAASCPSEENYKRRKDDPKCLAVYELRKRDTDEDGLADYLDWCPTQSGGKDKNGCPDGAYLVINPEVGRILTKSIHFEYNRAVVRPISHVILDTLVEALHAQPAIKKISIEGHTDNFGSDEKNLGLSAARARAVMDYLIKHGINKERLTSKGFGRKQPISDNGTPEGRARNRRVNFIIKEVGSF